MIGRGLRLSPETGKDDCHIIDIADTMSRGLVVSPTLLGLTHDDMEANRTERDTSDEEKAGGDEFTKPPSPPTGSKYKVRFVDEMDPFGLASLGDSSRPASRVQQMSWMAWVACGDSKFVLEFLRSSDYIQIERANEGEPGPFRISFHYRDMPFWIQKAEQQTNINRTKILSYADDLERAFQTADAFAVNRVGREASLQ